MRRPMTIEDLWAMPRVGAPAPSQDGSFVVVPVTTYSMETNLGTTRLWKLDATFHKERSGIQSAAARPLTRADESSSQPSLSPDGRFLAFVRKPSGGTAGMPGGSASTGAHPDSAQLFLLPVAGGEPERKTDMPYGVVDPQWFPDGRRIAFLSPMHGGSGDIEAAAARKKERSDDPVKAHVTEDRVYRFWDRWLTDGLFHHIFVLDLESGAIQDLTPDSRRWFDLDDPSGQYRISPDGREIAFAACRSRPPHDPLVTGIFTVAVPARVRRGGKAAPVVSLTPRHPADTFRPVYSPDGRWIVYGMQREIDFYADRVRIVAYDRKGGVHHVLTEDWDFSAMEWSFGRDARAIYILAEVEARTGIFSVELDKAMADPKENRPREIIRGGTFSGLRIAAGRIYTSVSTLSAPPEAIRCDLDGRHLQRLSYFTDPHLEKLQLSVVEEETFVGAGKRKVQMFLLLPPGVKEGNGARTTRQRWPLVHLVHGGPHGVFGDQWHWRWNAQLFAAPGYVAALVNFHGSTSWGQEFAASILGRWGDQPYTDVMAATDRLIARGLVDPDRMALAGGSYGGYLASWIASQTDRFAAIVNHAGVSDFHAQYGSDVTQGRRRSLGGEPWDNLEGLDRYNPLRHARGFRSPMLVIHGEIDYRVPYVQGLEIYNIYKAMKLPARLVCFPDEGHWILKPRNSRLWYREVLGWLDRWIGRKAAGSPVASKKRKK